MVRAIWDVGWAWCRCRGSVVDVGGEGGRKSECRCTGAAWPGRTWMGDEGHRRQRGWGLAERRLSGVRVRIVTGRGWDEQAGHVPSLYSTPKAI